MVSISRAEYEEFQAQRKKISELESRVDTLICPALGTLKAVLVVIIAPKGTIATDPFPYSLVWTAT